jgi:hypothetical protein
MIKTSLTAIALSAGLFMASCSLSDDEIVDAQPETAGGPDETALVDAQDSGEITETDSLLPDDTREDGLGVTGNDADRTTLQSVSMEDASMLEGELGCTFDAADEGDTFLIAKADVSENGRAGAAINNSGFALQLYGEQLGGFDGLKADGGTFAGEGMVIIIELDDATPDGSDTALAEKPATMTINRADGVTRTFDGEWECDA